MTDAAHRPPVDPPSGVEGVDPPTPDFRALVRDPAPPGAFPPGRPLGDPDLAAEISTALSAVRELSPLPTETPAPERRRTFEGAGEALLAAEEALHTRLEDPAGLDGATGRASTAALRRLTTARRRLEQTLLGEQRRAFTAVQSALGRLREIDTVAAMIRAVPPEVVRCGFDRALLSRVEESVWLPEAWHDTGDPEGGAGILDVGRTERRRIDHLLLESEMVRRRTALVVRDAESDPRTHISLRAATDTRSYVAAPIMPEGRVIGFLHADCYRTRREVDELDRDVLWMIAEGVGYALERTVLLERLESLRVRVKGLTSEISGVVDEIADAEVEVDVSARTRATVVSTPARPRIAASGDPRLVALLTRRELEIMEHMAHGESNQEIARRLIISEGTVKTHVKHILRKLGAGNRAEAVSRFLLSERT